MPLAAVTAIFQAADNHLNNTLLGESVIYTPWGGVAKSITMRIDRGGNLSGDESSNKALNYQARGFVKVSDIANPVYRDTITATGPGGNAESWTVLQIMESDSSTHTLALQSDLRPII